MTGRPTKCTPELIEEFSDTLERVLYVETACALHDISKVTYYNWTKRAERELERVAQDGRRRVSKDEAPFVEFLNVCARARAKAEDKLLCTIDDHATKDADGDWKAAAWKLERAFPYKWGKRERIEHSGKVDSDITYKVVIPPPAKLGEDA